MIKNKEMHSHNTQEEILKILHKLNEQIIKEKLDTYGLENDINLNVSISSNSLIEGNTESDIVTKNNGDNDNINDTNKIEEKIR
jgi:hypothetical protein